MATQREVAGHCNKLTKQQKVEENQVCGGPENLSSLPPSFGVKPRAVYAVVNVGGKGYFYIYHVAEAGVGAGSCVPAYDGACNMCCHVRCAGGGKWAWHAVTVMGLTVALVLETRNQDTQEG